MALVQDDTQWTYAQLDAAMRSWGRELRAAGVARGDRVAVLAPSSPELVAAMLGVYALGAIWVPINTRYRQAEVGHILEDAGPSLLLCEPSLHEAVPDTSTIPVRGLQAPPPAALDIEPLPDDAPAMLVYTHRPQVCALIRAALSRAFSRPRFSIPAFSHFISPKRTTSPCALTVAGPCGSLAS